MGGVVWAYMEEGGGEDCARWGSDGMKRTGTRTLRAARAVGMKRAGTRTLRVARADGMKQMGTRTLRAARADGMKRTGTRTLRAARADGISGRVLGHLGLLRLLRPLKEPLASVGAPTSSST